MADAIKEAVKDIKFYLDRIEELTSRNKELEAALLEADQFITNGIELGYIRMPDADVPDAAHHIPGNIRAALGEKKSDD